MQQHFIDTSISITMMTELESTKSEETTKNDDTLPE